mgnify:CR=1 FL=1
MPKKTEKMVEKAIVKTKQMLNLDKARVIIYKKPKSQDAEITEKILNDIRQV